jgi:hypothetical protein
MELIEANYSALCEIGRGQRIILTEEQTFGRYRRDNTFERLEPGRSDAVSKYRVNRVSSR